MAQLPRRTDRAAVVHVVENRGNEWCEWLAFRDLLRTDSTARSTYLAAKRTAEASASSWGEYIAQKYQVIRQLLAR
ncbi:hypothetical protein DEI81_02470 [Curtobacterium sp. MCBD17_013]|uniref:GrpB family protein n=1 Tax=Curtobacterium sp. MCBD17_013 TaxID=2175668 RepID=UPI000DA84C5C|nr:hypothetical protein DEI81_02470 [Curtobacterium sp. MCBD17_013]